jgi:drug/metabolite transporter (DMT)-like permease
MRPALHGRVVAAILALLAAFLWSTYYLFVLAVSPGTRPSAVLFYPFVGGGLAYAVWALAGRGGRRLLATFASGGAYVRLAMLLGMQLSVLAATYLTGPVDAALLSLLGDVVATPLVVATVFSEGREELLSPRVVAGLTLSLAGGALAILGGRGLSAIPAAGWAVVVAVPVFVALYFVLSARAGARIGSTVVVAQSMIAAAVGAAALSPLLPGGARALGSVGAVPLALLLANGVASFFVAPLLYFRAIEKAGLVFPPMLMTGIPVFTLLLSAALLGIAPAFLGLLGVPVAAVGGIVALSAATRAPAAE